MSVPKLKKAKCACCGSTRRMQWHHLAGRLFNILVALCSACHLDITTGLARLKIETSKAKGSTIHWVSSDRVFPLVLPRQTLEQT